VDVGRYEEGNERSESSIEKARKENARSVQLGLKGTGNIVRDRQKGKRQRTEGVRGEC